MHKLTSFIAMVPTMAAPLFVFACLTASADPDDARKVTFYEDVLPLFQAKCIQCHRTGQIAPMSLRTFEEARPWAKSIRQEVESRRMPPFYAAGPIGRFKDDLRLEAGERDLILQWIDGGARRGNPAKAPPAREWKDEEWIDGEPDLVIPLPDYTPRSDSVDDYVTLFTDFIPEEDLYYTGMQLRANNSQSLHHSSLFLVDESFPYPAGGILHEAVTPKEAFPVYTWFPGMTQHRSIPDGAVLFVPANKRMLLVAHFAPTDVKKEQGLELGVYLANGSVDKQWGGLSARITNLRIPPYTSHYESRATREFPADVYVTHFHTHMHLRGKQARLIFHYPDGRSETAYDLPEFSFDWQRYYHLAEPMFVPKGTRAEYVGVWDNSENNPLNPDPSKTLRWGGKTTDEMFSTTAYYVEAEPLSEPMVFRDGKRVEPENENP